MFATTLVFTNGTAKAANQPLQLTGDLGDA